MVEKEDLNQVNIEVVDDQFLAEIEITQLGWISRSN
jgi:hypothetical protein